MLGADYIPGRICKGLWYSTLVDIRKGVYISGTGFVKAVVVMVTDDGINGVIDVGGGGCARSDIW